MGIYSLNRTKVDPSAFAAIRLAEKRGIRLEIHVAEVLDSKLNINLTFGFDGYFSYWLCLFNPDNESLSFTCRDHESGADIDGAVYKDIIEFLEDMKSEYEENKDE